MKSTILTKTDKAEKNLRTFMFEHPELGNQNDALNAILEGLYKSEDRK